MTTLIDLRVPKSVVSLDGYRAQFTYAEKIDLYTKAETDTVLKVILADLQCSVRGVDMLDDRVAFGLGVLVSKQIISYDRMLEIISYRE